MQFGLNFFPSLAPAQKPAAQYFAEAYRLASLCDELGYTHIRQVEHYFIPYGGYSPSPLIFLTGAAQRTRHARLITGAVLPIFNHPLKLAGEIGMLDAISNGRLDVGFARAFLPHEFAAFGISLDESRARFDEGLAQIKLLLETENASSAGRFHRFRNVTSLPRPTQKPHPPIWVAATSTPQTFAETGRAGNSIMTIPLDPRPMRELIGIYRDAWRAAGHPGRGRVMSNLFMCCLPALARRGLRGDARTGQPAPARGR
jgi:alkanesulfonate monooxygenase SsuD/methylene tetrahydromethanopterin reductase-like flavin-dependent oxidoreductase (luciferase family)